MPFRERIKRVFRQSSEKEDGLTTITTGATLTSTKSKKEKKKKKSKKDEEWEDWPEHIYKPHEMPRPKYRRPPEAAHKEALLAYSWGEAAGPSSAEPSRPRSLASLYSPMGSRMPSRKNSLKNKLGPSRNGSRAPSLVQEAGAAGEDSDVGNVGLSRVHTVSSRRRLSSSSSTRSVRIQRRLSSRARHSASIAPISHPPLLEHPSAEKSTAGTPGDGTLVDTTYEDDAGGAALEETKTVTEPVGAGAALEESKTVTQASETAKGHTAGAETLFSGAELVRALTGLTAGQEAKQ